MDRRALAALAAAALLAAAPAPAQLRAADAVEDGLPASLALPGGSAAAAEEPAALTVNPAGVGFVRAPALQAFHEERWAGRAAGDGVYAAAAAGPVGGGLSLEWVRPGDGRGARYRKTTAALALTDGRSWSTALGLDWYASPDADRDRLRSFDLGATLRPWRHLSVGAAALGLEARLAGRRLPARYDVGVATRFADDAFTLSADLLADDRARGDFHGTHGVLGLAVETRLGVALGLQLQLALEGGADPSALVTIAWNGPHAGFTGGVVERPGGPGWLAGVRLSSERYRGAATGEEVPTIDVAKALAPGGSLLALLSSDRAPWLDLLHALERARDDPAVQGLVVRIGALDVGRGRIEELRARIAEVAARKPVLAYLVGGGTKEYLLATAATAVAAPPGAAILFSGIAAEPIYLRDALARVGVAVDVVKVGAWKSAPEPLTRADGSPAAREAIEALLDDVHARDVADVASRRGLAAERVEALFDRALFSAEEAKGAGLVDEVLWPDELAGWARRRLGRRVDVAPGYAAEEERGAQRWGVPPAVGVVLAEGTIVPGASRRAPLGGRLCGAETVTAALRRAADDPDVKAVVLRVDSGGGDGQASDLIWREVARTRERKPVVVSMGDLAASGGYLAAVAADAIVAEPSTLTGSIGVFAMKPDLSGLLDRAGAHREPHQRGEKALVASPWKGWTDAERGAVQAQVDGFYARFVARVAAGRRLSPEAVERVAQGRVWTGQQALERGLVDRIGSLADAVALAREKAGLDAGSGVAVRRVSAPRGLGELAAAGAEPLAPGAALLEVLGEVPEVRALALLAEMGPILALPIPQ